MGKWYPILHQGALYRFGCLWFFKDPLRRFIHCFPWWPFSSSWWRWDASWVHAWLILELFLDARWRRKKDGSLGIQNQHPKAWWSLEMSMIATMSHDVPWYSFGIHTWIYSIYVILIDFRCTACWYVVTVHSCRPSSSTKSSLAEQRDDLDARSMLRFTGGGIGFDRVFKISTDIYLHSLNTFIYIYIYILGPPWFYRIYIYIYNLFWENPSRFGHNRCRSYWPRVQPNAWSKNWVITSLAKQQLSPLHLGGLFFRAP